MSFLLFVVLYEDGVRYLYDLIYMHGVFHLVAFGPIFVASDRCVTTSIQLESNLR